MGLTALLDDPLYSGLATVDNFPAEGFVAIAGRVFEIDPRQYQRDTIPILKQASNTNPEPGESALNDEGLWPRVQRDWRLGAFQKYLDEADSVRTRVFASKGIDLWTPRQISLLNATEQKLAGAGANTKVRSLAGYLYVIDGTTVRFTADPTPASPAFTTTGALPAAAVSIAFDGSYLYVAAGGATPIQRIALAGTVVSAFGTFTGTMIGYGNGRILSGLANRLVELSGTGTFGGAGQLDWSHPNTRFVWRGVVSTPSGLYAWGDADGLSEVFAITVNPSSGVLNAPSSSLQGLPGETINIIGWYSNIIAIGTTTGLRLAAQSASNLALSAGSALLIPGGVTDLCFEQNSCWFTWTDYDTISTGLGRARLDLMIDSQNLVPAAATDMMVDVQANVTAVASHKGRRYLAVQGFGVYGQNADLVAHGTFDTGWITYGTVERKATVSVDLRHKPLAGSIDVAMVADVDVPDGGVAVALSSSAAAGSTGPSSPLGAGNVSFERVKLIFTLNRATDHTKGPVLRWWTSRAIPTPTTVDEIVVPIRMFTRVETTRPFATPGEQFFERLADFRFLKGLEANGTIVRYQEGTASCDVIIRGVQVRPRRIAENAEWFEAIVGVHLITLVNTQ